MSETTVFAVYLPKTDSVHTTQEMTSFTGITLS